MVLQDLISAAAALGGRVAKKAAGAGVHSADEHKAGWVGSPPAGPGDGDGVVFERLAQGVKHRAWVLW